MATPEKKGPIPRQETFFDKVVLEILVPQYASLNRFCFAGGKKPGKGTVEWGEALEEALEWKPMELRQGTLMMHLILN